MSFVGADVHRLRDYSDRFERHIDAHWQTLPADVDWHIASIFWVGPDARRVRHEAMEIVQLPIAQFLHDAGQAAILLRWGYGAQQKASSYTG